MSLRFIDSFDDRDTQNVDAKYYTATMNSTHVAGGRNGTNGADCVSSFIKWFRQEQGWTVGFAFYYHTDAVATLLSFWDILDQYQATITTLAGGFLQVASGAGAPIFGVSTAPLLFDQWQYIEVKIFCNDTNGTIDIHLDEVSIFHADTINTDPTGANAISSIVFPDMTTDEVIDDVYICDDNGTMNNDFLGDCHVECILPNDDGTPPTAEWFNGDDVGMPSIFQNVNEYPADWVHYNYWDETMAVPSKDVWGFPDIAIELNSILGVQINCFAAVQAAIEPLDTMDMSNICRSGGADYRSADYGDSYVVEWLGWDTYKYYMSVLEQNPDGDVDWLRVDFNAAEFGYELYEYTPPEYD